MPVFKYKALQPDGVITEGELEASGRQEAFRQMESRRLRPISLVERGNGKPAAQKAPTNGSGKPFALSLGSRISPACSRVCWLPGCP